MPERTGNRGAAKGAAGRRNRPLLSLKNSSPKKVERRRGRHAFLAKHIFRIKINFGAKTFFEERCDPCRPSRDPDSTVEHPGLPAWANSFRAPGAAYGCTTLG